MAEVPGDGWMSVLDASNYQGIATRTLYSLIDTGQVPAYRKGGVIRLRRTEVDPSSRHSASRLGRSGTSGNKVHPMTVS